MVAFYSLAASPWYLGRFSNSVLRSFIPGPNPGSPGGRMFCEVRLRLIQYRHNKSFVITHEVWVPYQREGAHRQEIVFRLRGLYHDIQSEEAQIHKAETLYEKIFCFTKAMYLAQGKLEIPPFIMHGWQALLVYQRRPAMYGGYIRGGSRH
eukprot:659968-Amphidinium_carterae.6